MHYIAENECSNDIWFDLLKQKNWLMNGQKKKKESNQFFSKI